MFDLPETKSFMDNVHGYIRIPKVFVRHIIDTHDFQRLRNIDQTGMKILYPAAKHDRFSHSLGVFHLGTIAVDALLKNFQDNSHWKIRSDKTCDIFWAKNKVLFLVACLLHDIGHTPFSHSLEKFYGFNDAGDIKTEELKKLLEITDGNAIEEGIFYKSNEHEKMSAFLVLRKKSAWKSRIGRILDDLEKEFYPKQAFESDGEYDNKPLYINRKELDDDIRFIARMILGVKYSDYSPERQVRNCFIELLNGSFDVDKLDYTVRDTEMSGISNTTIDIERLLSALTISATTVYVDTEVDIPPTQSLIITQMLPSENKTYEVKGTFDKKIPLQNCTISFPKNTKKISLSTEGKNISTGISTKGLRLSNNSIIYINEQLLTGKYKSVHSLDNMHLELKNAETLEDGDEISVGDQRYDFSFDSTEADEPLKIITHIIEIPTSYSINFSGSLKGHFKRFEILCDRLYDEGKVPTKNYYTGFSLGFKKQAINLISNVTDARN
jgi:HD superfamily phosphohydrolase